MKIAFIGFGEAGQAFAKGIRKGFGLGSGLPKKTPHELHAYDLKLKSNYFQINDGNNGNNGNDEQATLSLALTSYGVQGWDNPASAVADAEVVFSLVTAKNAEAVATEVAPHLPKDSIFCDGNSCSPEAKKRSAKRFAQLPAHYLDMALMAPVHPKLHETPFLLSGKESPRALTQLTALGMQGEIVGEEVGKASSIKLVRSIMIKGMEALMAECVITGHRLGVTERVLASLEKNFMEFNSRERAGYMLDRMFTHGIRRSEEMEAAAAMIRDVGLPASMAEATTRWQKALGDIGKRANKSKTKVSKDYHSLSEYFSNNINQK